MKVFIFLLLIMSSTLYANEIHGIYDLDVDFGSVQFQDELEITDSHYQSLWMGPGFTLHSSCFSPRMYQIKGEFISQGNFQTTLLKNSCYSIRFNQQDYLYFSIEIDEGKGPLIYEFSGYLEEVNNKVLIKDGLIHVDQKQVGEFSGEKRIP